MDNRRVHHLVCTFLQAIIIIVLYFNTFFTCFKYFYWSILSFYLNDFSAWSLLLERCILIKVTCKCISLCRNIFSGPQKSFDCTLLLVMDFAGVSACVAAVKCSRIRHHCVMIFFFVLMDHGSYVVYIWK